METEQFEAQVRTPLGFRVPLPTCDKEKWACLKAALVQSACGSNVPMCEHAH